MRDYIIQFCSRKSAFTALFNFGEHENEPGYTNHEFGQWQRECAQYMLDFMDE